MAKRKRMPALEAAEIVAGTVRVLAREREVEITQAFCEEVLNELKATGSRWQRWAVAPNANYKTVYRLATKRPL